MNVTYPLVPEEIVRFCAGKRAVLVIEEGQPAYLEDAILATLRRHDVNGVKVHGKDVLPMAGEYTGEVVVTGWRASSDAEPGCSRPSPPRRRKLRELLGARCRRARRASASAAPSGRCSRR